jgi:hypothetical protein
VLIGRLAANRTGVHCKYRCYKEIFPRLRTIQLPIVARVQTWQSSYLLHVLPSFIPKNFTTKLGNCREHLDPDEDTKHS